MGDDDARARRCRCRRRGAGHRRVWRGVRARRGRVGAIVACGGTVVVGEDEAGAEEARVTRRCHRHVWRDGRGRATRRRGRGAVVVVACGGMRRRRDAITVECGGTRCG